MTTMKDIINYYCDFCEREFGCETDPRDVETSNMLLIEAEDNGDEIKVTLNLDDMTVTYEINNEVVGVEDYFTYEEIEDNMLNSLTFDDDILVHAKEFIDSVCDQVNC